LKDASLSGVKRAVPFSTIDDMDKLQYNDDGSIDLYFGPIRPDGMADKNYIKTVEGRDLMFLTQKQVGQMSSNFALCCRRAIKTSQDSLRYSGVQLQEVECFFCLQPRLFCGEDVLVTILLDDLSCQRFCE
jgi:hypothetical protein